MTVAQLLALGGMLALLCCVLVGAGFLVMLMNPAAVAPTQMMILPTPTPVPPPSLTLTHALTYTPTVTAIVAATDIPAAAQGEIPEGWRRFANRRFAGAV